MAVERLCAWPSDVMLVREKFLPSSSHYRRDTAPDPKDLFWFTVLGETVLSGMVAKPGSVCGQELWTGVGPGACLLPSCILGS